MYNRVNSGTRSDTILYENNGSFSDGVLIKEKDLEKLMKIYKFEPNKEHLILYDKKWNKVAAKFMPNFFNEKDYDIYFSKNWLYNEAMKTSNPVVLDIMKNNIQCQDIYEKYKDNKDRERRIFALKNNLLSFDKKGILEDELEEDDTE